MSYEDALDVLRAYVHGLEFRRSELAGREAEWTTAKNAVLDQCRAFSRTQLGQLVGCMGSYWRCGSDRACWAGNLRDAHDARYYAAVQEYGSLHQQLKKMHRWQYACERALSAKRRRPLEEAQDMTLAEVQRWAEGMTCG